jgi:hypothetical protein
MRKKKETAKFRRLFQSLGPIKVAENCLKNASSQELSLYLPRDISFQ